VTPSRQTFLFLLLGWPLLLHAQEVKYIDLSSLRQRTELRHPPRPPADCKEGTLCGGSGGGSVGDGAPDWRDPHALGIYLLHVIPTDIDTVEPFEVEFRILNTGRASIELPVSPHLSDLQPSDESVAFSYFSLSLVVQSEPHGTDAPAVGFVELYGSPEHEESMMVLKPGEWIRVKADVRLIMRPLEPVSGCFQGDFWLRKNTFRPHPRGEFRETQNLYPNTTPTPCIAVHLFHAASSNKPK